jgi:hypothetical protein
MMKEAKADTSFNPPDTILRQNDPAPYYGVLVNPINYKQFTVDHQLSEDFTSNMDKYVKCQPPDLISAGGAKDVAFGFAGGTVFVILLLILVPH